MRKSILVGALAVLAIILSVPALLGKFLGIL